MKVKTLKNTTLLIGSTFFILFGVLAVSSGVQMVEVRDRAQQYFESMHVSEKACANQKNQADCMLAAEVKRDFDYEVSRIDHYRSLMLLFFLFSIFLPLLAFGGYRLTLSVFNTN